MVSNQEFEGDVLAVSEVLDIYSLNGFMMHLSYVSKKRMVQPNSRN